MTRRTLTLLAVIAFCGILVVILLTQGVGSARQGPAAAILAPHLPFTYSFKIDGVLEEAGSMRQTTSPYWWVNSGGRLILKDGTGMTIQGRLSTFDRWRLQYNAANPVDTDDGYHPQNLFRLLSRSKWQNPRVEGELFIVADNLSESPNRNESNGVLFISRYQNEDTLYYAGIRVDGHAVIKKKYRGTYYTMAEQSIFPGSYDPDTSPNLLPHSDWFALRVETITIPEGVLISLFMRDGTEGSWVPLLSAVDDGSTYDGTPIIENAGFIGIRTDFMDVQFRTIHIEELTMR